jgi:PGF-pre-PGF domain-containing protein
MERKYFGFLTVVLLSFGLFEIAKVIGTNPQVIENETTNIDFSLKLKAGVFEPEPLEAFEVIPYSEFYIIQFEGPIREEWKTQLKTLGVELFDYLPNYAFIVRMDENAKNRVARLEYVRWIGEYKSQYKIHPSLGLDNTSEKTKIGVHVEKVNVTLLLFDEEDNNKVLTELRKLGGKILSRSNKKIRVEVDRSVLDELSEISEVEWIEEYQQPQLLNDVSRWVIQSYINLSTPIWDHNVTGEGQIIGVADTGLDNDSCYFSTDPNKVVAYLDLAGNGDFDAHGHGTHVSGTILGDKGTIGAYDQYDGMAFSARLVMQDVGSGGYLTGIPSDLNVLFQEAYDYGARIHSNSWGYVYSWGDYNSDSQEADEFMWNHSDFLILFAAGNSGPSSNSVSPPATAKNVVSVGATKNGFEAENMAWFSSHGPTDDGRLKPTVTAPGYNIVSARSDYDVTTYNCDTRTMSGTSMATPTVAGAAALIRQYFTDGYYPTGYKIPNDNMTPSGALLKAMLINSARDMNGSYTEGHIPSNGQGWGRILLDDVLYFFGDSRGLRVFDESRGLTTGDSRSYSLTVYNSSEPLKVTLVWTDYPSTPAATKNLVNDLNLVVEAPTGTYLGNVFSDGESVTGGVADDTNVVEEVLIKNPAVGTYTIRVEGYNVPVGPQPFALVITGGIGVGSKGFLILNSTGYKCNDTIGITLGDMDLDVNNESVDSATINITSSNETESVVLTETGNSTGIFTGSISLVSEGDIPGELKVVDGEIINATYYDNDTGSGESAVVLVEAYIDCVPPNITIVLPQNITYNTSDIDFDIISSEPLSSASALLYNIDEGHSPSLINLHKDTSTHWYNYSISPLENAYYNATFTVKDLVGNSNSSAVFFTVAGPTINVSPSEIHESLIQGNVIQINITVRNDGLSLLEFNVTGEAYFLDDMESGARDWIADGFWHLVNESDNCKNSHSGNYSWYYGDSSGCTYSSGSRNYGALISQKIKLSNESGNLTFWHWLETEDWGPPYDAAHVQISNGSEWQDLKVFYLSNRKWEKVSIDISSYSGETVQVRFYFDTVDGLFNNYRGWYVDDVEIDGVELKWLSVNKMAASIDVGNQTNVTLTMNSSGLTHGNHSARIRIDSNDLKNTPLTVPVTLMVNDTTPPIINIITPANGSSYNISLIPLNFTVNEEVLQVNYSLNGQENITVEWNTTLRGVKNDLNNVTVYALDLGGNLNSNTSFFNVTSPDIEISPSRVLNLTVGQGDTGFTNFTIINRGYDPLIFNLTQTGATEGRVKAVVLDSWGTDSFYGWLTWSFIEDNWDNFGEVNVTIDYVTLNKEGITYEDIATTGADVLIVSDAWSWWYGWEFSDSELDAISRYVKEGHGIVVTSGSLDSSDAPNNVPGLAPLLGLNRSTTYNWLGDYFSSISITSMGHPIFSGVEDPYEPNALYSVTPSGGDWNTALTNGKIIGISSTKAAAIVVGDFTTHRSVYLSNIPEYLPNSQDYQILYNSIVWAATTAEWLSTNITNGTIEFDGNQNVNVTISAVNLTNGSHRGRLRIDSNDLDETPLLVTVNLDVIDLTPPNVTVVSPVNNSVYNTSRVDFVLEANEPLDVGGVVWVYSLNSSESYSIPLKSESPTRWYNRSAPLLSDAYYNATFVVRDLGGNEKNETVFFRVSPPDINISFIELNITLNQSDINTTEIVIENNGSSDLEFSIDIGSGSDSLKIFWYDDYEEYSYSGSIREYLESKGHNVTYSPDYVGDINVWEKYPDYDVVVAEHTMGSGTLTGLDSWFAAGKGYVALINYWMYGDAGDSYIRELLNVTYDGLPSGELPGYDWDVDELYWQDSAHPIKNTPNVDWDIRDIETSQYRDNVNILGGETIVASENGKIALQVRDNVEGKGRIAYLGTNFHGSARSDPDTQKLVENMIVWAAGGQVNWINVSQSNGSIAPGNQTTINVTISAVNLTNGSHRGRLRIDSNDLDETPLLVTVNLDVIDLTPPNVTVVSPVNNSVYNTSRVDFVLEANEPLDVGGVVWVYSLNSSESYSIPLKSESPTRWYNRSAPLLSDAYYNATFVVRDLGGNEKNETVFFRVAFPNVSVTPSEINLTLDQGNISKRNITIKNTGEGGLEWEVVSGALNYSVDTIPFEWESEIGTSLSLGDDDYELVPLNFTFNFYGVDYNSVYVGSNGFLRFTSSGWLGSFVNLPFPSSDNDADNMIAPLWDDLNPYTGGGVYYNMLGSPPDRRFIVTWYKVPHYYDSDENTFQVILYEKTNEIKFNYLTIWSGNTPTAGINYGDGIHYAIVNETTDNTSYLFVPGAGWVSAENSSGLVSPGKEVNLTLLINSNNLRNGSHYTKFGLETNDPNKSRVLIPINLEVNDVLPPIINITSPPNGYTFSSGTTTVTITASISETDPDTLILNFAGTNNSYNYSAPSWSTQVSVSSGNSYSFYIWANDTSGNSNQSETRSFSVESSTQAGGTQPPETTPPPVVLTITYAYGSIEITGLSISAGTSKALELADTENMPVVRLTIAVKNSVSNAEIIITTMSGKPWWAPEIDGTAYRYFEIGYSGISDAYVDEVDIKFKVERSWIDANNIDPSTITLYRYSGGKWNALSTYRKGEDSSYIYYSATSPGLSIFGISGQTAAQTPTPSPTSPPTSPPQTVPLTPQPENQSKTVTPPPTMPPTPLPKPKSIFEVIEEHALPIATIILIIIAIDYYRMRRRMGEF